MNSNNSDLCAPGYDVLRIPNVHSLFQDVIYNNVSPGPDHVLEAVHMAYLIIIKEVGYRAESINSVDN